MKTNFNKLLSLAIVLFTAGTLHAQTWNLTGNTATTPGTNFIGTTDSKALYFKTNSNTRIAVTSAGKVGIGTTAPSAKLHVEGFAGTIEVFRFSNDKSTGKDSIMVMTSNGNVGIGTSTPLAKLHLVGNTNFTQLIIDAASGQTNANPVFKLRKNSGVDLMHIHTDDPSNIFIGINAGKLNSFTGLAGYYNTFLGYFAGDSNSTGFGNSAIGSNSMRSNESGYQNTAIGLGSLYNSKSGSYNTATGWNSLMSNTTGSLNTAIGSSANVGSGNLTNATAVGANTIVAASNALVLGNNANVGIGTSTPDSKLHVVGSIKMVDGNEAAGKVLMSDINGVASWQFIAGSSQWTNNGPDIYFTAGNVGIGTAIPTNKLEVAGGDAQINGVTVGCGAGLTTGNTALGSRALASNTIGARCTAIGDSALFNNGIGAANSESWVNTAIGASALKSNTIGYGNTATGSNAMQENISGILNTSNGYYALAYNTTGNRNVAMGNAALFVNTDGFMNTAVGSGAMNSNTSGSGNVAIGNRALFFSNTFNDLVAIGDSALYNNGTGVTALGQAIENTAIGAKSMFANTTGYQNTGVGFLALSANVGGWSNSAFGTRSLSANSSGGNNTAMGFNTLISNSSGSQNTALGVMALSGNTTGSNNTAIGYNTQFAAINFNNSTAIGANAIVGANNTMSFGSTSVTGWQFGRTSLIAGVAIQVGTSAANGNGAYLTTGGAWTNGSDENLKENFTTLNSEDVLKKISLLNIPSWNYKGTSVPEKHIGPMAQQFYDLFGTGLEGDREHISTIDPAGVALIGIQALRTENDALKNEILEMRSCIETLCASNQSNDGAVKINKSDSEENVLLGQNIPNPFDNSTVIPFRIPKNCSSASIMITETSSGKLVTAVPISCSETHLMIEAGKLSSGTYTYILYIDGRLIDSKQMVISK